MTNAMKQCRMTVFIPSRRKRYVMRWIDPLNGRRCERSTGCARKRDAYEFAAEFAKQLVDRLPHDGITWAEFREAYESCVIRRRSSRSQEPWKTTVKWIERLAPVKLLSEITTAWVTKWQQKLREVDIQRRSTKKRKRKPPEEKPPKYMGDNTVASYSARLKAALRWAKDQGYLRDVPIIRIETEDTPRSRAITLEEFERILAVIPKVRPDDAMYWDRLLRGQWHCGFRISEVAQLSWDKSAPIRLETGGRFPFVSLAAKSNKSKRRKLRAITPEFWAVCEETPPSQRHGLVFPIPTEQGTMSLKRIIKIISKFGSRAGVITNPDTNKKATSHDTRRGFAVQMDHKGLTLAELQKWMDHSDIRTTLTYYRTVEAEQLAAKVWKGISGASGGAHNQEDSPGDSEEKRKC